MRVGSIFDDFIMAIYDDKNNNQQLYSTYCAPGTVLIALQILIHLIPNPVRWVLLFPFTDETECKLLAKDHIASIIICYTVSSFSGFILEVITHV